MWQSKSGRLSSKRGKQNLERQSSQTRLYSLPRNSALWWRSASSTADISKTIKPDPTHPSRIGLSRGYGITGESLFSSLLAAMQPVMLYPRKAVESL
jgi:hypothetical protein